MTDTTVTVEPARPAPVVPESIDPIEIVVSVKKILAQPIKCLLPGNHERAYSGSGCVWMPHKHSAQGTMGILVVTERALLEADGGVVVLDQVANPAKALAGGWEHFDPNTPLTGVDPERFRRMLPQGDWTMETTDAAVVWSQKQVNASPQEVLWHRLTIPFGSDLAIYEWAGWGYPGGNSYWHGVQGFCKLIDSKIRDAGSAAGVAMVRRWTGSSWLGSPAPQPLFGEADALRYLSEHNFRKNPNQSGAFARAGNGTNAAAVLWPREGASPAIADELCEQLTDFENRIYWFDADGNPPKASAKIGEVTFHKENPWLTSDSLKASLAMKLGWETMTNAHLRADGVDHQHEGGWLLVSAHALFDGLDTEVMLSSKAAMLRLDRNFEMARTDGNLRWLQNGRGRGRPQGYLAMIAHATYDAAQRNEIVATLEDWVRLRASRREQLRFPTDAPAQVLTKTTDRSPQPFFTGYEEAIDAMAVMASLPLLSRYAFTVALREVILLGRLAASTMRKDGGVWKSGYQVPCDDAGDMLPTTSYPGPDLQFWTIGGLKAYVAAAVIALEKAPGLLDHWEYVGNPELPGPMVSVAQQAIAYFDALGLRSRHSTAETMCAVGQGGFGVDARAWATSVLTDTVPIG